MLVLPTEDQLPWIARAIKTALAGDDELTEYQRMALTGIARGLLHTDLDVEALAPLSAEQTREHLADPAIRAQTVQAMIGLSMLEPRHKADGSVDDHARISLAVTLRVKAYAAALDVDAPSLKVMEDIARDHMKRAAVDELRKSPVPAIAKSEIHEEGFVGFIRGMAASAGKGENLRIADRFRRLEDLPDGTWGKQVVNMYQDHGWIYPGCKDGPPEPVSVHDWVHIAAGYPPSISGELQVWAFIVASSSDRFSFGGLLFPLVLYGVGGAKPLYSGVTKGGGYAHDDVGELFSEAVTRSLACGTDMLMGVDHWALAAKPVEQIREEFRIPEKTFDIGDSDPGLSSNSAA